MAHATIRERRPGTPHRCVRESESGQAGNDGATALEQATAEEHPQEMEETQIGTNRYVRDHTRQRVVDAVDYGDIGQAPFQVEGDT